MFTWWICLLGGVFVGSLTHLMMRKDLIKQMEALKAENKTLNEVNEELHNEFLNLIEKKEPVENENQN